MGYKMWSRGGGVGQEKVDRRPLTASLPRSFKFKFKVGAACRGGGVGGGGARAGGGKEVEEAAIATLCCSCSGELQLRQLGAGADADFLQVDTFFKSIDVFLGDLDSGRGRGPDL